ncbi:protein of unknown function [Peptoclostridium litorale DSM 5388]|uniref:DUF4325 domain-containing protein n=1 Tax=Peptoclostridium litorale DSM 5388 TaxID=1121324 RepID=A0A069RGF2_PEPLI|nr:STAS-like domain-containing protein [Peptoclostridium litorale]KDR95888.1 hypothetical protein CLIT_8c00570 [Peptoclostridium litorale DSM 5388]SIO10629.1 protein of unknown function [Peptoclostridium litorale DSM 5388]
MKIIIKEISSIAISSKSGMLLRQKLEKALESNEIVTIDFCGVDKFASMYFNASIGYVAQKLGREEFNRRVKIVNITINGKEIINSSIENSISKKESFDIQETLKGLGD